MVCTQLVSDDFKKWLDSEYILKVLLLEFSNWMWTLARPSG